ncbi:hypothetical protein [Sandaracinobacteroides hominis]|uniref:hypothetical protein n=1 Tax=Sandaracinobacteroides hominis TaxID=2780086 RepID=UPI0018F5A730|nr:hypothetical protein [Sandaracinobacteroides hominis]
MDLTLRDLDHLFRQPELDPLNGSFSTQSGVEAVLQRLKRARLPKSHQLRLSIQLPADQISTDTRAQVASALAAYAATRIAEEQESLHFLGRETRQSLRMGGLFLIACLTLAALVDYLNALPSFVQTLLRESLVIAGWVGLWHPLDLLLYAWWPSRYRISLLKHLETADVQLKPAYP